MKLVRRSAIAVIAASVTSICVRPSSAVMPVKPAEYTLGSLHILAPWIRATPKGATVAGGYLTIRNMGTVADRLLGVESAIAGRVEVHEMKMDGGVMTMRPVEAPIDIPPGGSVELKPGGYHVMFMQLRQGIGEGDKIKATLVFEKAGRLEIEFLAGAVGAGGPGGSQMPMKKM